MKTYMLVLIFSCVRGCVNATLGCCNWVYDPKPPLQYHIIHTHTGSTFTYVCIDYICCVLFIIYNTSVSDPLTCSKNSSINPPAPWSILTATSSAPSSSPSLCAWNIKFVNIRLFCLTINYRNREGVWARSQEFYFPNSLFPKLPLTAFKAANLSLVILWPLHLEKLLQL